MNDSVHHSKPVVILVRPQMGENIGAVARAMANFGLRELRIVAPRDGWPNPAAEAMAACGKVVVDQASIYDSLEEALADVCRIYATTARPRDMAKPVMTAVEAVQDAAKWECSEEGNRVAFLFGPERSGLTNDEVALADVVLEIPTDPEFTSLNLGQAALLVAYEWWQLFRQGLATQEKAMDEPPATGKEMQALYEHLEGELDRAGFWRVDEKRPAMVRNIRTMLRKMEMTSQEARTWRGIIRALTRR